MTNTIKTPRMFQYNITTRIKSVTVNTLIRRLSDKEKWLLSEVSRTLQTDS